MTEDCLLVASDIHYGKSTSCFDSNTVARQLSRVGVKIAEICNNHSRTDFGTLHIALLGDIVDGSGIYPTQNHHQEITNPEKQAEEVSTLLARFAESQTTKFKNVHFHCVAGNHGRSGWTAAEAASYDLVCYKYIKYKTASEPRIAVDFNSDDPFVQQVQIKGHKYILQHGDGVPMYCRTPFYGIETCVKDMATMDYAPFDVALFGHFHTSLYGTVNKIAYYLTGTSVVRDEWSRLKLRRDSVNRWWFLGVSDDRAVSWEYQLELN